MLLTNQLGNTFTLTLPAIRQMVIAKADDEYFNLDEKVLMKLIVAANDLGKEGKSVNQIVIAPGVHDMVSIQLKWD